MYIKLIYSILGLMIWNNISAQPHTAKPCEVVEFLFGYNGNYSLLLPSNINQLSQDSAEVTLDKPNLSICLPVGETSRLILQDRKIRVFLSRLSKDTIQAVVEDGTIRAEGDFYIMDVPIMYEVLSFDAEHFKKSIRVNASFLPFRVGKWKFTDLHTGSVKTRNYNTQVVYDKGCDSDLQQGYDYRSAPSEGRVNIIIDLWDYSLPNLVKGISKSHKELYAAEVSGYPFCLSLGESLIDTIGEVRILLERHEKNAVRVTQQWGEWEATGVLSFLKYSYATLDIIGNLFTQQEKVIKAHTFYVLQSALPWVIKKNGKEVNRMRVFESIEYRYFWD